MKLALLALLVLSVPSCAARMEPQTGWVGPTIICLIDQEDRPWGGVMIRQLGGRLEMTDLMGCATFPSTKSLWIANHELEEDIFLDPSKPFHLYRLPRKRSSKYRPA